MYSYSRCLGPAVRSSCRRREKREVNGIQPLSVGVFLPGAGEFARVDGWEREWALDLFNNRETVGAGEPPLEVDAAVALFSFIMESAIRRIEEGPVYATGIEILGLDMVLISAPGPADAALSS